MPPAFPPWPAPDAPAAAPGPTTRPPAAPPSRAGPPPRRAPAPPPSTPRPCDWSTARRPPAAPPAGAAAGRAAPASGSSVSSRCPVAGRRARPDPRRCTAPAASRPTAPRTRSSRPPRPPRDPSPAARSPGRAGPSGCPPRRTCLATSRFGLRAGGRRDFPAGMNRADLMALDKTTLADLVLRQAERIAALEARLAETGQRFEELERRAARAAPPLSPPPGGQALGVAEAAGPEGRARGGLPRPAAGGGGHGIPSSISRPASCTRWSIRAVNWLYTSEPSEWTGGRRIAAPRGKTLGGSSSINGHIYNRGQRLDFDGWAQRGNRGWGYADVLPYFRRSERRMADRCACRRRHLPRQGRQPADHRPRLARPDLRRLHRGRGRAWASRATATTTARSRRASATCSASSRTAAASAPRAAICKPAMKRAISTCAPTPMRPRSCSRASARSASATARRPHGYAARSARRARKSSCAAAR